MRTSPGKLITPSAEYARRAATTSRFSSAPCSFESVASFVRSLSDISDRKAQKSSTEIGARIENRRRRSDAAVAPAFERIDNSFPVDLAKPLAESLRHLRRQAGLTQGAMARRLGISRPTLNRLESASQNTTLKTIGQLCRALQCQPGDLFTPNTLRHRGSRRRPQ